MKVGDLVRFPDDELLALRRSRIAIVVYVYETGSELGLNSTWDTSFVEILCSGGDIQIHDMTLLEVMCEGR